MNASELRRQANQRATDLLVGRTIRTASYEGEQLVLQLDDDTLLIPMSDDEGNGAGALHYQQGGQGGCFGALPTPEPPREPRSWRNQHPGADVPPWIEANCEDCSWRHDAMPIFHYGDFAIFVDYADSQKSEFCKERTSGKYKRFSVHALKLTDGEVDGYGDLSLLATDDVLEVVGWFKQNT